MQTCMPKIHGQLHTRKLLMSHAQDAPNGQVTFKNISEDLREKESERERKRERERQRETDRQTEWWKSNLRMNGTD